MNDKIPKARGTASAFRDTLLPSRQPPDFWHALWIPLVWLWAWHEQDIARMEDFWTLFWYFGAYTLRTPHWQLCFSIRACFWHVAVQRQPLRSPGLGSFEAIQRGTFRCMLGIVPTFISRRINCRCQVRLCFGSTTAADVCKRFMEYHGVLESHDAWCFLFLGKKFNIPG